MSFLWTPTANVHVTNTVHTGDANTLGKKVLEIVYILFMKSGVKKWHMDIYTAIPRISELR